MRTNVFDAVSLLSWYGTFRDQEHHTRLEVLDERAL